MFSKQLIDYTESTFKSAKIDVKTGTMVKEVSHGVKHGFDVSNEMER